MILKSLSIKNYCGFTKEHIIDFAKPDGERIGSGLTLITGENKTGKSTIIRALKGKIKIIPSGEIEEYFEEDGEIKLTIDDKTYFRKRKSESWINKNSKNNKQFFEIVPAMRKPFLETREVLPFDQDPLQHSTLDDNYMQLNNLSCKLKKILNCYDSESKFYKIINKILPEFQGEFYLKSIKKEHNENGNFLTLMYKNDSLIHHTGQLVGDGILSVVMIASSIVLSAKHKRILIIDEPELHLHPNAQKRLAKLLSIEAKTRQIILMTHSPYFVDWYDFFNNAEFIRTSNRQGCFTIYRLKHKSTYRDLLKNTVNHWKRPHLFDLATKEIFFSDKVLFVEGQEDVGLIKNWLRNEYKKNQSEKYNYSFEIFGYGVNGVDNIPKFLCMAKDLGIKKVGVLTDKLAQGNSEAITTWKEKFNTKCNYKFQELITPDIRKKIDIEVDKLLEECIDEENGKLRDSDTIIDDINKCIKFANSGYFDLKGQIIKCSNCEHTEPLIDITKCNSDCKHASLMKIFNEFNKYFDDKTDT